ncbi:MAG: hypothetical protein A2178_00665 [Planctomycetes bacterium GWC2_49_10]|nr:MAG: hypothetical protein A2178_00665 [Planctomycetes bacterium GWC2_49_10]
MKTLLLIDDELDLHTVFKRFFTASGWLTATENGGSQGLKTAARIKPDLIVLDLNMPDINGAEVLSRLANEPSTELIPVIIWSGEELKKDAEERMKRLKNFRGFFSKPASFTQMEKKFRVLLGF